MFFYRTTKEHWVLEKIIETETIASGGVVANRDDRRLEIRDENLIIMSREGKRRKSSSLLEHPRSYSRPLMMTDCRL